MQKPLQIQFRGMDESEALAGNIRDRVEKLEHMFQRATSCRVVVEQSHTNKQKGNLFQVKVEMDLPGKMLTVSKAHGDNHAHEDPYVAVRDAFDAMERQLRSYSQKIQGKVKHHEPLEPAALVDETASE